MECKHEQIRCTDNVFYCLKCGAVLPDPFRPGKDEAPAEKPAEAKKTASKRRPKKEAE